MSLTVSCKLVEVFAMICAVFCYKIKPKIRCTLALNPAFSVTSIESSQYGGPPLWLTFAVADYDLIRITMVIISLIICPL